MYTTIIIYFRIQTVFLYAHSSWKIQTVECWKLCTIGKKVHLSQEDWFICVCLCAPLNMSEVAGGFTVY